MNRPFIVAEMSANHLGDLGRALALVDAAADAGADAIKLQIWTPGTMAGNDRLMIRSGPWAGQYLAQLYEQAHTPWDWWPHLATRAHERGLELFAAAFDLGALRFLESYGVRRHKIASFELVDIELVSAAADTGKPLILSTGMASYDEIQTAVDAARLMDCVDLTLLRCVSAYPAPAEEFGLGALQYLRDDFQAYVGLSDHSLGDAISCAAVALGADMIEKHLTLRRKDGGPDCAFSLEPAEFKSLVDGCRAVAAAVPGETEIGPSPSERTHLHLRRSLWWDADLPAGTEIQRSHVRSARPADGLPCHQLGRVLESVTKRAVRAGDPIEPQDLG